MGYNNLVNRLPEFDSALINAFTFRLTLLRLPKQLIRFLGRYHPGFSSPLDQLIVIRQRVQWVIAGTPR